MRVMTGIAIVWLCSMSAITDTAGRANTRRIVIVSSSENAIFQRTADAFWQALTADGFVRGPLKKYMIFINEENAGQQFDALRKSDADLIFTLGNFATLAVRQQGWSMPHVFAMVFQSSPDGSKLIPTSYAPLYSGVIADIPVHDQLQYAVMLQPQLKRIGTIFSRNAQKSVESLKGSMEEFHLSLTGQLVRETNDLLRVVRGMEHIELFWMIPDPAIYAAENWETLFRWLRERQIVVYAPSPRFLSGANGADWSMTIDPAQHGQQAADIAARFLRDPAAGIPVQTPSGGIVYVKQGRLPVMPAGAVIIP